MSQELDRLREKRKGYQRNKQEREVEAVECLRLKILGWRDIDIAEKMNLTRQTVAKRTAWAVATHGQQDAITYREIAAQRYESLINTALSAANDENTLEVVKVVADLTSRFTKLVGAEAPVQVAMEVTQVTEQEKALREMLAQAERDEKARETVLIEGEVVADAEA